MSYHSMFFFLFFLFFSFALNANVMPPPPPRRGNGGMGGHLFLSWALSRLHVSPLKVPLTINPDEEMEMRE